MQFILTFEEYQYLKISIMLAKQYISDNIPDLPECVCLKTELQASVLTSALEHIHDREPSELDEDEIYHVQRAIALRLFTLSRAFFNDGSASQQRYQFFRCEINYLLNAYNKLM